MSFTPLMIKLIPSLLDDLNPNPRVVELGNQTFDATISGQLSKPDDLMLPRVVDFLKRRGKPFDAAKLAELAALSPQAMKPHTATYFKALGFASYTAIDVNSVYGSLIMDLNVDLQDKYGYTDTFDLVTNNGTGEHIFNQYAVFKNMHQLARPGGVLLFVLPFYNWMNHGFFNFNPLLFTDLAAANGYEIVRVAVGCPVGQEVAAQESRVASSEMRLPWQPETATLTVADFETRGAIRPRTPRNVANATIKTLLGKSGEVRQQSKLPGVVESLAERVPNINVIAALRKKRDEPFRMPLQGMYAGQNVESAELRQAYDA
jgi:SAM-dependent methyltransferase